MTTEDELGTKVHDLLANALQCFRDAAEIADQFAAKTDGLERYLSAAGCYAEIIGAAEEVLLVAAEQLLSQHRAFDLLGQTLKNPVVQPALTRQQAFRNMGRDAQRYLMDRVNDADAPTP